MTKGDKPGTPDPALGATIASSDTHPVPRFTDATAETITPAQAIATSETVTPAEALGSSETVTPAQLAISETVTPAEAAAATTSVNRGPARSQLPEIARATYAVRRELARGGMGRILVADDSRLGRRVAIKELISKDRGLQRRFAREVQITAKLQHPGIVPVYEAGHWPDGEPFYAMKLVAGTSLEKVVEAKPDLTERLRLIPNLVQLTEAIAYAHGSGVIHRDLKPANVLVGDYGETVVIDWGLAKEISEGDEREDDSLSPAATGMTMHGAVVGTPAYMPPEQARGETVGARADVYSLGALMWHVLAGRPPYLGTVEVVLETVRSEPPPPLTEVAPGIPGELATIVEHAMERDPDLRYPTARELAEELSRFQTGQLVTRHHYTTWQLFKRWVKRHRALVMSSAALLVGATIVGVIAMRQVMAERDRARAVSLAALEEQGRRELVEAHPLRASVFLSEAYRGGRNDEALRLMLGEAMKGVDAAFASWKAGVMINHLAWASSDELVAIASDGTITVWDVARNTRANISGDVVRPDLMAMTENGSHLAVVGGTSLRIVDLETRTATIVKLGGVFYPRAIKVLPGGDAFAIQGTDDARVFATDGKERAQPPGSPEITFPATNDYIGGSVRITESEPPDPTTGTVATSSWYELVQEDGTRALARRDEDSVAAIDRKGDRFAAGSPQGQLRLWDVATGLQLAELDAHTRAIRALAFEPTGKRLASAGDDGVVRLWDLSAPWLTPAVLPVKPAAIAATSTDGRVRASARLNEVLVGGKVLRGQEELISWIDVEPDGATVVAGARDGRVLWWDVATGRTIDTWQLTSPITSGDLSRDGTLAVGARDGSARIFHGDGAKPIALADHASAVHALAWHPQRAELLSAADTAVRVWSDAGTLLRYLSAGEIVGRAWWSADGRWILVDGESTLQVWDGQHGTLLARTPHALLTQPQSPLMGDMHGASDDPHAEPARLGATGFVSWPLARETRPAPMITKIVAERSFWRLSGGELVPAANLVAMHNEEAQKKSVVYDFTGDTLEATPSKPALPLSSSTPAVTAAFAAIATNDRAAARSALARVTDTQDARTAYDAAWCWHFIGDEQAAYRMALRAYQAWQSPGTKPQVLGDLLRLASWAELPHDSVVNDLGAAADNKTRLALAQAYDDLGRYSLVIPTIESMTITDDWVTRARGLYLMARRSYMRGDLASAAEHLEVAARMIPPANMPAITLGEKCGDIPRMGTTLEHEEDAAAAIGELTQALAAESFSTFSKVYDYRYATAARRLYALLGDKFGVPRDRVSACNVEIDALAGSSYGRTGALDKAMLRNAFHRPLSALLTCYQREVDSDASVGGQVMVLLEIATNGQVASLETYPSPDTPAMRSLATCVQNTLSRPELPRQAFATRTLVSYPLTFTQSARP